MRLSGKNHFLRQSNNHFICVAPGEKEIVDCLEPFAMILCHKAFVCYVGDGLVVETIAEIGRIELQPINSSKGGKSVSCSAEKRWEQLRRQRELGSSSSYA